jgi:hypothetical protein
MEKGKPHCSLPAIKAMIAVGKVRSTLSALAGGAALGFDFAGMVEVVMSLSAKDFLQEHDDPRQPHHLARRVPHHNGCW